MFGGPGNAFNTSGNCFAGTVLQQGTVLAVMAQHFPARQLLPQVVLVLPASSSSPNTA